MICNCFTSSHLVSDDHSRVKLEHSENDYINASLVMVEEAQRAYILSQVNLSVCIQIYWNNIWSTWKRIFISFSLWWVFFLLHFFTLLLQGPLRNTCGHFWLMIWEQSSKAVIMLNRVIEKGSVSTLVHLLLADFLKPTMLTLYSTVQGDMYQGVLFS